MLGQRKSVNDCVQLIFQGQIDAQLDTLAEEQISAVCHSLGVASMYPIINNPPTPLSQHPTCHPLAVQAFMVRVSYLQYCRVEL